MQVNYQRDSLDTVRTIDLPAFARIGERRYRVARWSFHGFYVDIDDEEAAAAGRHRSRVAENGNGHGNGHGNGNGNGDAAADVIAVDFVLPFATHEAAVKVACRAASPENGQRHYAFLDLQPPVRKLMRDYFDSAMTSIDPDPQADYSLVVPLTSKETGRLNGSLLRRLVFYVFVAAALAGAGLFIWREFSYVYSLRGTVMGDLVQYRSPDQGSIRRICVKDGDRVVEGQLLYVVNHEGYDTQLAQLRLWKEQAEGEVKAAQDAIDEESTRAKLYTRAAQSKLEMLQAQRTGLLAQVDTANGILAREKNLYDAALVPKETFDIAQGNVGQLRAQLVQIDSQIALQNLVIEQSKENRFLSTSDGLSFTGMGLSTAGLGSGAASGGSSLAIFDIKGNMPALRSDLATRRTAVAQIGAQCSALEAAIARCEVKALGSGVVNHVNRREGDSVASADYVLSITADADSDRTYVAARFTADDARFIAFGMTCEIVSLTRNKSYTGKVDAIDSGLGQRGSLAPDEQMAPDELVVKFELPAGVRLRGGESVFVKLHRGFTLAGLLEKFR